MTNAGRESGGPPTAGPRTGRKLLDETMTGDDQKCPYVVMAGPGKKIYAEVSNRAVVAALRKLVTK
ncbi:hypothetical protein GA0074695_1200 [Micromonospora viridifaciens]|uniref:Uncharacterized protein n=1 Tax=Micromonospora viridifaciens TaxID=1881 RepID=A0A1C4V6Z0_MICVI|nr:hypothetical protein GA0074695_1200 [Micromonospora viridifaciens]